MRMIESGFDIGQVVYLKTDKEQAERMITGIMIRPSGISYAISCGASESWHYEFEIVEEKNIVISTTN
jgi:hypothetical protein